MRINYKRNIKGGKVINEKNEVARINISISEYLAIASITIMLSAMIYIYNYTKPIGSDVLKYFTINDYLNISVKTLLPTISGFFLGFAYNYLNFIATKKNTQLHFIKKIMYLTSPIIITILFILGYFQFIDSRIANSTSALIVLFIVISLNKSDILYILDISITQLVKIVIVLLIFSYLLGSINGNSLLTNNINLESQTLFYKNDKYISGKTVFVLNQYVVFRESKSGDFNYVPVSNIEKIKYNID